MARRPVTTCLPPNLPPLVMTKECPTRKPAPNAGLVYDRRRDSDGFYVKPLSIFVQHGHRTYDVILSPNRKGVPQEISMRHLAEKVHQLTNVKPDDQTFIYKGVTWGSCQKTIGQFPPLLRDLGVKNGDKILLASWPGRTPDQPSVETLKKLRSEVKVLDKTKNKLMRQLEEIHQLFGQCGGRPDIVTTVRQRFLHLKEEYMVVVQRANALNFDHRNSIGQATRRHLIDDCQRQMDKCFTAASHLFDRLALNANTTTSRSKNRLPQLCG